MCGRQALFSTWESTATIRSRTLLWRVFVRDLVNLTTGRVSVATGGTEGLNGDTQFDRPSISADGRYVAFASTMTNLVAGDTNNARDIFRHDRQTGTTIRVSVNDQLLVTVTDSERPYSSGKIGLYSEDAEVYFDNVSLSTNTSKPGKGKPRPAR